MNLLGDLGKSKRGGSDKTRRDDLTLVEDVLSTSIVLGRTPDKLDHRLLVSEDEEEL